MKPEKQSMLKIILFIIYTGINGSYHAFSLQSTGFVFWGQIKNKHHLLVDPPAAEVVKKIFDYAYEGMGYKAIAKRLKDESILNPNAYNNIADPTFHQSNYWRKPHDWHPSSIKSILSNITYQGHMVSGRRRIKSFKCKEVIKMPQEEWVVVKDMHEAIIDQHTWDIA